jgi:hypothetical protein
MSKFAGDKITASDFNKVADIPRCRALATAAQTIPNSTFTAISFPAEDYKVLVGHDTISNPTFYSCQVAGLYALSGGVYMATNSTGVRALKWQKNGVDIPASGNSVQPQTGVQTPIMARVTEVQLAVGDFVTLLVFQGSGGNLDTYVGADYARPSMSMRLIRDDSL